MFSTKQSWFNKWRYEDKSFLKQVVSEKNRREFILDELKKKYDGVTKDKPEKKEIKEILEVLNDLFFDTYDLIIDRECENLMTEQSINFSNILLSIKNLVNFKEIITPVVQKDRDIGHFLEQVCGIEYGESKANGDWKTFYSYLEENYEP